MVANSTVTYLHYLSILLVFGGVIIELFLVKKELTAESLKRIVKADAIYGLFSILLVTTGLLRVFLYGKGSDYYFGNWIFILKFSLFIVIGLLSILPTVTFLKLNKKLKKNPSEIMELPAYTTIRRMIQLELILLLLIPLLAVLMANGVGMLTP